MRRGKRTFIIVSIIVLITALVFVCYQLFRVRNIDIVTDASADYVESLCGIKMGDSIFFVDKPVF